MRCAISILLLCSMWARAAEVIGTNALLSYTDRIAWATLVNYHPGHNEEVMLNPPRFTWFYAPDYTNDLNLKPYEFQFQISSTTNFATPIVDVRTPLNFYNTIDSLADTTNYWRVGRIALTNMAITNWSETRMVRISPSAIEWDRAALGSDNVLTNIPHPRLVMHQTNRVAISNWLTVNESSFFADTHTLVTQRYVTNYWWSNVTALDTNYWISRTQTLVYVVAATYASHANLGLSGLATNSIDVNGSVETLTAGDRILVKAQTDATANGVYVAAAGAWSRATDLDSGTELTNFVFIAVTGDSLIQRFLNVGGVLGEAIRFTNAYHSSDAYDVQTSMADSVNRAAFIWQLTRDPAITNGHYPQIVYEWLCARFISQDWWQIEPYSAGGGMLGYFGFGRDWLDDVLSVPQRTNILHAIHYGFRNFYSNYWFYTASGEIGAGSVTKRNTSHPWSSQNLLAQVAIACYDDGPLFRLVFDALMNYAIGKGTPVGDDEGYDRGRGYNDSELGPYFTTAMGHFYRTFHTLGWTNHPGVKGLANQQSFFLPVGYRHSGDDTWGDGGAGYPGISTEYYTFWQQRNGGAALAKLSRSGAAQFHYERQLSLNPFANNPTTTENSTMGYYYPAPATNDNTITNLSAVFPEGGWVFGYSQSPKVYNSFSNGVAFAFQARPSSGDNNHTFNSDLDIQIWAYGAPVTEGGGPYASQLHSAGYARNVPFIDNQGQRTEFWPTKALKAQLDSFKQGTNYVYASATATTNYIDLDMALAQRHVLFMRGKYFVIYDDLASKSNSIFADPYHVRPMTLTSLSRDGFSYVVTNLFIGRSNVTVTVRNIATNGVGVRAITNTEYWEDLRTSGEEYFVSPVVLHPFTGHTNNNSSYTNFRSYALYFTNAVAETNRHFMKVITATYGNETPLTVTRIDENTAQVSDGVFTDVIQAIGPSDTTNELTTLAFITSLSSTNGSGGSGGGPEGGGAGTPTEAKPGRAKPRKRLSVSVQAAESIAGPWTEALFLFDWPMLAEQQFVRTKLDVITE